MRTRRITTAICLTLGVAAVLVGERELLMAQQKSAPAFSHPTQITHPYLPLASFQKAVFEGKEGGKAMRVVRTRRTTQKTFLIDGKRVAPLVIEDRDFEAGKLKEVTLDYFAQDDAGTVYYLGEDVDNYRGGKIVGHEGAWLYGKGKAALGVLLPANPKVGDKYQSENVPNVTTEDDEVVSVSETVTTPTGTYQNCLKVKETLSDGGIEYKVYAKGVGMVVDDTLRLVTQTKKQPTDPGKECSFHCLSEMSFYGTFLAHSPHT